MTCCVNIASNSGLQACASSCVQFFPIISETFPISSLLRYQMFIALDTCRCLNFLLQKYGSFFIKIYRSISICLVTIRSFFDKINFILLSGNMGKYLMSCSLQDLSLDFQVHKEGLLAVHRLPFLRLIFHIYIAQHIYLNQ